MYTKLDHITSHKIEIILQVLKLTIFNFKKYLLWVAYKCLLVNQINFQTNATKFQ